MKFKQALQKYMIPALEAIGFTFEASPGPCYYFCNAEKTREIILDLDRGNRFLNYCFRLKEKDTRIELNSGRLLQSFFPTEHWDYDDQEELELHVKEITEGYIHIIMPYFDAIAGNVIADWSHSCPRDMYEALAKNPQGLAKQFTETYGLSLTGTKEEIAAAEAILIGWQTDMQHRKEDFQRHKADIIAVAAYAGEVIRLNRNNRGFNYDNAWERDENGRFTLGNIDVLDRAVFIWDFHDVHWAATFTKFI